MAPLRLALTVLVALVACSDSHNPKPSKLQTITAEPDRFAPAIAWRDNSFVIERLPAVARAADVVVVPLRENDAGRGFPNLRLELRGRNDRPTSTIQVLNSNDYERLAPGGVAGPTLVQRITSANAQLEQLHATHHLVAMRPLELQTGGADRDPHIAVGDGLEVDWTDNRLVVVARDANRVVASANGQGWLVPPHPSCASCDPCENPAFLGAIYHAPAINLIVAQIRYRGTDACWEPSDQFHVVAW